MKHAGTETLEKLESLLAMIRILPGLVERKRGTFYKKSSAFLHFHEDPAGIFADVKIDGSFQRFSADTPEQWAKIIKAIKA